MPAEVARLVAEYDGAISGEHGCGLSRSWSLPQLFGPELYSEFVGLKRAFDPQGLLGPGHIVDGPDLTEDLRFGPDYRGRQPWRPRLSWAAEGGFDLAIETLLRCRPVQEAHRHHVSTGRRDPRRGPSTRARANALQALVAGAVQITDLTEAEFSDVIGSCVACKACKTECPAGVDMAALKVEWLAERRARQGVPILARVIANLRRLFAVASPFAPLVNAAACTPLIKPAMRLAGVAPQRPAPAIARRPLTRSRRGRRAARRGRLRGLLHPVPGAAGR